MKIPVLIIVVVALVAGLIGAIVAFAVKGSGSAGPTVSASHRTSPSHGARPSVGGSATNKGTGATTTSTSTTTTIVPAPSSVAVDSPQEMLSPLAGGIVQDNIIFYGLSGNVSLQGALITATESGSPATFVSDQDQNPIVNGGAAIKIATPRIGNDDIVTANQTAHVGSLIVKVNQFVVFTCPPENSGVNQMEQCISGS